jgi:hypothetical protein
MRTCRPGGRALARRLVHLSIISTLVVPAAALAADISGIVVDPDGRPLPRAHVVVVYRPDAGTLAERPASFTRVIGYTDQSGRF